MNRQAATTKGFDRRIRDLHLNRVPDHRYAANVDHEMPAILSSLIVSIATLAKSLRQVEQRTTQISARHADWHGLRERIADNTFGKILPRLEVTALLKRLHDLVKAEHRRGNLEPTLLPIAAVAIDGKNIATLHWHDLCRVLKLDENTTKPQKLKKLLAKKYPNLQLCIPKEGLPYALARVHTVTLTSSSAALCIHQRAIPGCTNEIGAMPGLLKELRAVYGRSKLFSMVTTDAGNTSLKVSGQIVSELRMDYFAQIKSEHGELHKEAVRVLGNKKAREADASDHDTQNGDVITYRVWRHDLSREGWLDWTHARQLIRVQRTAEHPITGKKSVGNRYYVSSKESSELTPKDSLKMSRGHWRCEEETHWTADAVLQEDRRRLSWSRHPVGVYVVAVLRMMALAILAIARKLSRLGYSRETPTWHQVAEHFTLALCGTTLDTEAFDAVSE
jgi:hypothetical protein